MHTGIDSVDWAAIAESLRTRGWATTGPVLDEKACANLRDAYAEPARFRSRVVMARHRFGEGEYQYFANPLPPVVRALREQSYRSLAPLANSWQESLGHEPRFPATHQAFAAMCHAGGQERPTPLLLRYSAGGYNCLHQDLYGPLHFPLQMAVMLSRPGADYEGGHFLLVENRPRAQSTGEALRPGLGEAIIFTTRERPVAGTRGYYRTTVRHGVSTVTEGERYVLGIVYHDAE